jgi:hypothetical protein
MELMVALSHLLDNRAQGRFWVHRDWQRTVGHYGLGPSRQSTTTRSSWLPGGGDAYMMMYILE